MKRSPETGLEDILKQIAGLEDITKQIESSSETDPYAGVDKESALLTAASKGDFEAVNSLIAHGVQVVAKDKDGINALMLAIQGGHTNVAQVLIKAGAGANINEVFKSGDTYLHEAAYKDDVELTKLLLQSGADVGILNDNGKNALHIALMTNVLVAKVLIEHGANISIKGSENQLAKFGQDITPMAMKLFAAQTKKNKNYQFIETVIDENQIDKYLSVLKSVQASVSEKVSIRTYGGFIPHWYSAEIRIDNNEVKLLLVDSQGHTNCRWDGYRAKLTTKIRNTFSDYKFSTYIDPTKRQHEDYSCSAFTLSDIKDLHKIKYYLPGEYSGDIFKFCEKYKYRSENVYGMNFNYSLLPLRMMRSTQSIALLEEIIPQRSEEEKTLPVNKKKQTALESSELGFILSKNSDYKPLFSSAKQNTEKKRNFRSKLKLEKILDKTLQYLINTPIDEIKETMEEFGLSGLKKRLFKI